MGTTKWADLKRRSPVSAEARELAEQEFNAEVRAYNLTELRRLVSDLTQEELAQALGINQSAVSKLERAEDMTLSRLRETVETLGGTIEVTATFGETRIPLQLGR